MTADQFRRLALSLPQAVEESHMNHPDFRVGGKIFATLGPDEAWGMVKLTPEQQKAAIRSARGAFKPASGAWGRRGATTVDLAKADKLLVEESLMNAWRNTAPKKLVDEFDS
jgi:hypothetical protein